MERNVRDEARARGVVVVALLASGLVVGLVAVVASQFPSANAGPANVGLRAARTLLPQNWSLFSNPSTDPFPTLYRHTHGRWVEAPTSQAIAARGFGFRRESW